MKIAYITNSSVNSGVGKRAYKIREKMMADQVRFLDVELDGRAGSWKREGKIMGQIRKWPGVLGSKSVNWIRLGRLANAEAQVYDLTNQSLSFMAKRLKPAVVTVHDLIEMTEPQNRKANLLNRYLYSGIKDAEVVIAVSQYTAGQMIKHYGLEEKKIRIIHNGVDPKEFYPITGFRDSIGCAAWRSRIKAREGNRVLLYVGSEHPRKNMRGLLQVFKRIREKYADAILIKAGGAGIRQGRKDFLDLADELQVRPGIRIFEDIPLNELNEFYNLAEVLVFPSRQEGFGLPLLEAFAAGLPVVASNVSSIPEVAGGAAVLKDPDDIEGMALAIGNIFEDEGQRERLFRAGLERIGHFSWEKAASEVMAVYRELINV